jgi:hypothetical protein
MTSPLATTGNKPDHRWRFWRDVLVFQLKMLLGSFRDFALIPVSLGAALIDLIFKGEREGDLFYKVLRWAWHSEEVLDVYSPIKHETDALKVNPNYTVDSVIARLEGVLVRECEKGGTAASIKAAMDRAIDQLHRETSDTRDRARDAVVCAADRLRGKFDSEPREKDRGTIRSQKSEVGNAESGDAESEGN